MTFIIDEHRIGYYDALPGEARPARLDDFHLQGRKRIGMPFICKNRLNDRYVVYRISDSTSSGTLKFCIDLGLVFVFTTIPECVIEYYN